VPLAGKSKGVETGLAAVTDFDRVAVAFQQLLKKFAQERFVINAEDLQRREWAGVFLRFTFCVNHFANGQDEAKDCAFADFTLNFDGAFVAFCDAINHGEAEPGAALAFGPMVPTPATSRPAKFISVK
jgi:hypothetical protein